ncbi:MAG TPA: hypothetical protein DCQ90_09890 [Erysipelotrichaceae bacterium]|nr:peptidylprolyl isomerase [Erysipelotrichaceae bacterium]HAO62184.1 hypothetical protein [Erysipelotrichaceae bacterium]
MVETLKKQWFVVFIAFLLLCTVVYFVYDQNKDKLPGKSVGGKDIVFEINGTDVTADELYDELYETSGIASIYSAFERAVIEQAFEGDKDTLSAIKLEAEELTANTKAQYEQYYGDGYEEYIASALKANGYGGFDDLNLYFTNSLKIENMVKTYLDANMDTYFPAFNTALKPRIVNYVVIAMDDPDKPTEEESKHLKDAQEAWAKGTYSFEDFAKEFSEDGAASTGGYLGYFDFNSSTENGGNYDNDFSAAAMKLTDGQVSPWVKSDFGWHLITVKTGLEALQEEDDFYSALASYKVEETHIRSSVVWAAAQEIGVDFGGNTELEAELKKYMNLDEAE